MTSWQAFFRWLLSNLAPLLMALVLSAAVAAIVTVGIVIYKLVERGGA